MRFQSGFKLTAAIFVLAALSFVLSGSQAASGHQSRSVSRTQLAGTDKCLSCHRAAVGQVWKEDWHFRTLRGKYHEGDIVPEVETLDSHPDYRTFAADVDYVMGGQEAIRFINRDSSGRFELLTIGIKRGKGVHPARWFATAKSDWEPAKFAEKCEGCHTTGLNLATRQPFEYFVGCEACHGPHNPNHINGSALMRFAKKARETPQVIASTCGSCHLRGGHSRSTDRPWPNNFVAGDNLFKDFVFDFASADNLHTNPIDKHVRQNIRDITVRGKVNLTCLSCHDLHPSNSDKHRRRPRNQYCMICHTSGSYKKFEQYEAHSKVCEY